MGDRWDGTGWMGELKNIPSHTITLLELLIFVYEGLGTEGTTEAKLYHILNCLGLSILTTTACLH